MVKKTAAILACGVMLSACAVRQTPVPLATNFPVSTQYTLQAAAHWGVIADDIERQLIADMKKGPPRPYYIAEPGPQASPFQRALNQHLVSALVRDGQVVSRTPAGSLKVDLDIQALTFTPGRDQERFRGVPTALAAGVWALYMLEPAPAAIATAGTYDVYRYHTSKFADGPTPKTEIIITVSISDQYRYYARNSSAYYVADTDRTLYGIPPEEPVEMRLMKNYPVKGGL